LRTSAPSIVTSWFDTGAACQVGDASAIRWRLRRPGRHRQPGRVMGRADLCVETSSKDNAELWSFLQHKVHPIPGVRQLETMAVLKVHKLRYSSPAI
jgi:hypothetical protein